MSNNTLDDLLPRILELMGNMQHLQTGDRQRLTTLFAASIELLERAVSDALLT